MSARRLILGGALALLACSAPIRALPASLDPSNPDGPEGVARPVMPTPGLESSAPAPAHQHAPSYACPMHPEVVQPTPGQCPKCGMRLVQKESKP